MPTGGGGLLAGIALAVKAQRPDVRVVGVQAEGAAAFPGSLAQRRARRRWRRCRRWPTASRSGCPATSPFARRAGATSTRSSRCREESLSRALLALLERAKMVVEPAGAAAVAALLDDPTAYGTPGGGGALRRQHRPAAARQGDPARHGRRPVATSTCGSASPTVPGGLARLLTELGEAGANILEVAHERISPDAAPRRGRGADPDGDPRRAARRAGGRPAARVRLPRLE